MIKRLSEVIPLQAVIETAGGSKTAQFQLTGKYCEFVPVFESYDNLKAILADDPDRQPVLVKVYDNNAVNYVRNPASIHLLNQYFHHEAAQSFLLGAGTINFEFSHDNTIAADSPSPLEVPITCNVLLFVNYLSLEEYNDKLAERGLL